MSEITAVILAAGRGLRMGARGKESPKGLLRLLDHSLVEQSVLSLKAAGVRRIRIVTGHLASAYYAEDALRSLGVELRHNPAFAASGSLHSLLVGLEDLDCPVLLLESDLIYEPRALEGGGGDHCTVLVSGPTGAGDEVYVWTEEDAGRDRLLDISKDRRQRSAMPFGELVGITWLAAPAVRELQRHGSAWRGDDLMADYESGLVRLNRQVEVSCKRIDDLAWAEIDDEDMLRHAAEQVHPRIMSARRARGMLF